MVAFKNLKEIAPLTLTLTRTLTLTLTQRADPNQAVPLSHVPQGALADHVPQAPSP